MIVSVTPRFAQNLSVTLQNLVMERPKLGKTSLGCDICGHMTSSPQG